MSVYSRQQQQNLNDALQAFGSAPAAPAAPPPASPLPDVTLNYSPVPPSPCPAWGCGPAPVQYATSVSPVPTTPAVSSSSGIPTWGWVAIALGGAFLLTRK